MKKNRTKKVKIEEEDYIRFMKSYGAEDFKEAFARAMRAGEEIIFLNRKIDEIKNIKKENEKDTARLDALEREHRAKYLTMVSGLVETNAEDLETTVEVQGDPRRLPKESWMIVIGRVGWSGDTIRDAIDKIFDGLEAAREQLAEADAARQADEKK